MSDTPVTDAACFDSFEDPRTEQNAEVVLADVCRQLERELALCAATLAKEMNDNERLKQADELLHKAVHREEELLDKLFAMTRERDALLDDSITGRDGALAQIKDLRAEVERLNNALKSASADSARLTMNVERLTRDRDEWKRTAEHLRGMAPYADANAEVERLKVLLKALIEAGDKMRHYQRVSNSYPQPSGEAWDRAVKEVRGEVGEE